MQKNTVLAYICLGANEGDTEKSLERALHAIDALSGVEVVAFSQVYYTEPQEKKDQPWFSNQILRVECGTQWSSEAFLKALLEIETSLGRKRSTNPQERFGARAIDIDLLLFGQEEKNSEFLMLPHPRMLRRAFVLVPLQEVAVEPLFPASPIPTATHDERRGEEEEYPKTLAEALKKLCYRQEKNRLWQ